jgi:O-antigen/teichoic acid export membrane protein
VQRSFLKNLFWLQALNWLIKPIWILVIERQIQLQLGDEFYGQYAVHLGIGTLFAVLLDAGINAFISREIAVSGKLHSWKRILGLRLALAGLYVVLVLLFSGFQRAVQWHLIGLVLLNQLLAAFVLLNRAVLQGRHQFKQDSILSVLDRFTALVVLIGFYNLFGVGGIGKQGVEKFLFAQGIGYLVAAVLGMVFTRGDFFGKNGMGSEADIKRSEVTMQEDFRSWLISMGWFVLLGLAMSLFTRLDIQMLQWFTLDFGAELDLPKDFPQPPNAGFLANGLYAKGYRFLDAALIFSSMLSVQLLPLFSKRIAEKTDVEPLVWLGFRIVLLVSILAATAGFFYGKPLMQAFYHIQNPAESHNMGQLFFGFMLVFVWMSTVHVFGTLLTAAGDVRWLSFLALLCVGINVGVDAIRIPVLGPFGALEGGLLTQAIFALGCMVRAHRLRLFEWKWERVESFVYIFIIPLVVFGVVKTSMGVDNDSELNSQWLPIIISMGISAVVLVYAIFGKEISQWKSTKGID